MDLKIKKEYEQIAVINLLIEVLACQRAQSDLLMKILTDVDDREDRAKLAKEHALNIEQRMNRIGDKVYFEWGAVDVTPLVKEASMKEQPRHELLELIVKESAEVDELAKIVEEAKHPWKNRKSLWSRAFSLGKILNQKK